MVPCTRPRSLYALTSLSPFFRIYCRRAAAVVHRQPRHVESDDQEDGITDVSARVESSCVLSRRGRRSKFELIISFMQCNCRLRTRAREYTHVRTPIGVESPSMRVASAAATAAAMQQMRLYVYSRRRCSVQQHACGWVLARGRELGSPAGPRPRPRATPPAARRACSRGSSSCSRSRRAARTAARCTRGSPGASARPRR